jgi:hypothetical protein
MRVASCYSFFAAYPHLFDSCNLGCCTLQVQPDDSSEEDELQPLGPPPPPLSINSSSMNSTVKTSNTSDMQQATASTGELLLLLATMANVTVPCRALQWLLASVAGPSYDACAV